MGVHAVDASRLPSRLAAASVASVRLPPPDSPDTTIVDKPRLGAVVVHPQQRRRAVVEAGRERVRAVRRRRCGTRRRRPRGPSRRELVAPAARTDRRRRLQQRHPADRAGGASPAGRPSADAGRWMWSVIAVAVDAVDRLDGAFDPRAPRADRRSRAGKKSWRAASVASVIASRSCQRADGVAGSPGGGSMVHRRYGVMPAIETGIGARIGTQAHVGVAELGREELRW